MPVSDIHTIAKVNMCHAVDSSLLLFTELLKVKVTVVAERENQGRKERRGNLINRGNESVPP